MKLHLAYYGHPILQKKTKQVELFDEELRQLVQDMAETLEACRGLGLAAPQVGVSRALFLTNLPSKDEEIGYQPGIIKVYINPRLENVSEAVWIEQEGCLSIPKVYAPVERPTQVTVTAQNECGQWRTEEVKGWRAKVIFHENDHLNGVLFPHRLPKRERKRIEGELEQVRKRFEKHNQELQTVE